MKKILILLAFIVQGTINAQTYYDANDNLISKKVFDEKLLEYGNISITNDSLNKHKILFVYDRIEKGVLSDAPNLFKILNEKLHLQLDNNKPLIIYYYPGKDPCNSSGVGAKRRQQLKWDKELNKKVRKVANVNVLRIYKSNEGLKTLKDYNWKKDPNALIEHLFFNYHYNCGSFVIINKDKYSAYFGEYGREDVATALENILKK